MSTFPGFDRQLYQYTVNELKDFLRSRSLSTGGLKKDLIKRLTEALKKENEPKNNDNKCDDSTKINKPNDDKINMKYDAMENIQNAHMTFQQAMQLKVNDKIDHRDFVGRFIYATVKEKQGTNLKIHYEGWLVKWDTWSSVKHELYRFAKPLSISQRPAHRFKTLKHGDCVDINPLQRRPGWKCGEVRRFDSKSGQIEVRYGVDDKGYLYWTHLDNKEEIAEFTSKTAKQNNSKKRKLDHNNNDNRPSKRQKVSGNNNAINEISSPLNKVRRPSLSENAKYNKVNYDSLNEKYLAMKQKEKRLNEEIVSLNQQIFEKNALLNAYKQKNTEINNLMGDYKKENEELKELTEKRLNEEMKSKHELNQKILQQNHLLNVYKMEIEGFKKNNNDLEKKLDSSSFGMVKVDTLNLDELNELKLKMQEKIKLIEETEKELMDNTYKCVACMNKAKNISFIDGCSHIALCDECEAKSVSKLCPLCQTAYTKVRKINF